MSTAQSVTWRAAVIGRWTARIVGTLMALFFLAFFVGEGFPNIFRLPWRESLSVLAMSAVVVGLLLAWKWEGLGGAVALAAIVLMHLIGIRGIRTVLLLLPAATGLLHVACWWRLRSTGVGWEAPRKVLAVVGLALVIFILICANEMFGMPPLMTPAFRPPRDMVGTWEAKLTTMDAVFTINPAASVSGRIGDSTVIGGRIVYNRSWFGQLVHWRTEYLMVGKLSKGDRFTAPLTMRGVGLEGALFLSQQPVELKLARAQQPVEIRVDGEVRQGPFRPIFSYFGYDEPNYTYSANGKKLIGELAALSPVPVQIRAHHLLVTGDGTPALKWGSTNAYTEDAGGKPVYDWTILDRIFDTYINANARPFVEIGFMPEALSTNPEPYTRHYPKPDDGKGWSYPPKDYAKWAELVRRWVVHSVERYGKAEVEQWSWELWNEPDGGYWRGTPEEYDKLYDYTADAIKRALPAARVGGPGTTGPGGARGATFLKQFLEHCARGANAVTGKRGAALDFISFHAKGWTLMFEGHARMGLDKNLVDVQRGLELVNAFPEFRALPIVLSECDPEGCAACSARLYPQNAYRNGTMYPSYTAASLSNIFKLADRYKSNVAGMLTWAFEFEDQPYFEGFRTLATNGIDKPILNLFRMAGLMHGDRVKVESSGALGLDAILESGVHDAADIDGLATRADREMAALVWNYHDDDLPADPAPVHLALAGIPKTAARVLVEHYRIDDEHSNAYTAWKQMGSPQQPSPEQYARLEAAGELQLLESPQWLEAKDGKVEMRFPLPRHAVSLVRVSW